MSELCKNTAYQHENHYGDRYNGYCLECSNAGVAELHDRIRELEARLGTALCCSRCGREPMRERGEQVVCTECVSELEADRDRLEAACAAMREAIQQNVSPGYDSGDGRCSKCGRRGLSTYAVGNGPEQCCDERGCNLLVSLSSDAGAKLLAERDALKARVHAAERVIEACKLVSMTFWERKEVEPLLAAWEQAKASAPQIDVST